MAVALRRNRCRDRSCRDQRIGRRARACYVVSRWAGAFLFANFVGDPRASSFHASRSFGFLSIRSSSCSPRGFLRLAGASNEGTACRLTESCSAFISKFLLGGQEHDRTIPIAKFATGEQGYLSSLTRVSAVPPTPLILQHRLRPIPMEQRSRNSTAAHNRRMSNDVQ